jgi:hypothetical protein
VLGNLAHKERYCNLTIADKNLLAGASYLGGHIGFGSGLCRSESYAFFSTS